MLSSTDFRLLFGGLVAVDVLVAVTRGFKLAEAVTAATRRERVVELVVSVLAVSMGGLTTFVVADFFLASVSL